MLLTVLKDIFHTPVIDLVLHLKRSAGMSVNELSREMGMSYMGVKQHCAELAKKGYLETTRRPKPMGRPERIYRVTTRLDELFPHAGEELAVDLLKVAERAFGETGPQKLLYTYFQKRTERYAAKMRGETPQERLVVLAKLRTSDGCLSTLATGEDGQAYMIQFHCPMAKVAAAFPIVETLEHDLLEKLLQCQLERSVEESSGLKRVIYRIQG
ncbi:MAG: winged helix-turn-helix transcriptional regulator [Verrucomicrobiaceae bacterium]|nr:winged helix-turn-helix transcriptional regulator [Verrucomicrobiaceae bacterium]